MSFWFSVSVGQFDADFEYSDHFRYHALRVFRYPFTGILRMARRRTINQTFNKASTSDLRSWVTRGLFDAGQLEEVLHVLSRRKSNSARVLRRRITEQMDKLAKEKRSGGSKRRINPRRATASKFSIRCTAITKSGSQCQNAIKDLSKSGTATYCSVHLSITRCLGTTTSTRGRQCKNTVRPADFTDGKSTAQRISHNTDALKA